MTERVEDITFDNLISPKIKSLSTSLKRRFRDEIVNDLKSKQVVKLKHSSNTKQTS